MDHSWPAFEHVLLPPSLARAGWGNEVTEPDKVLRYIELGLRGINDVQVPEQSHCFGAPFRRLRVIP